MSAGIGIVLIAPSLKARNALIRVIQEVGDLKPVMKSNSESAKRAHYAPMPVKIIINTASEHMHELLGHHSVAYAIEVEDRVAAAEKAKKIFNDAGFEATVHTQAEPEFPHKFLTFVAVPLGGIVVMFWPRMQDVTEDLIPKLPKREPWTDEDLLSE